MKAAPRCALTAATFALCVLPVRVEAQACSRDDSIEACYRTLLERHYGLVPDSVGAVQDEVAKATAGAQLLTGSNSAIKDFLPRIGASLLTAGLDADREALAFQTNRRWTGFAGQLGIQVNESKVYQPLLNAVEEERRSDAATRLSESLEDHDNVSVSLAFNVENRRLGRRVTPNRDELTRVITELLPAHPASAADAGRAVQHLIPLIRAATLQGQDCARQNAAERPLLCFRETFADSLVNALDAYAAARTSIVRGEENALNRAGFYSLAYLINNQPQLNGSLTYTYRGDLVGPDQMAGTLRFEMGLINLNWLRRRCGGGAITGECYRRHMSDSTVQNRLARGARLFGEIKGTRTSNYEHSLAIDSVSLTAEMAWEVTFTGGFGQYVGGSRDDTVRPRFDADVNYMHQLESGVRNSRGVVKISYTLPFTNKLSGVLGLTWANKPESVGEVTRKFGANLGGTYKLTERDD